MKSKDLIRMIQKCDPSGELEVCCDNEDISFIETLEAYYDGRLQVLKRDEKGRVVGAKITSNGHKVKIHTKSIEEAILEDPELPVEFDLDGSMKTDYEQRVAKWRATAEQIYRELEQEKKSMETMPTIVVPSSENQKVHQGRWGFYPCSYETCQKLKALNKHFEKAQHQAACWDRWNNKQPHNRVVRCWTRDAQGRRNGFEIVGRAEEPEMVAPLQEVVCRPGWRFIAMKCVDITQEYRKARYPVDSADKVKPLNITVEKIDALLKELGE